jgi:hypothetical protein
VASGSGRRQRELLDPPSETGDERKMPHRAASVMSEVRVG